MPQMSSADAKIHDSQNLIHAQNNPVPEIPLVKLGNSHKEVFISLAEISRKTTPPSSTSEGASQGAYYEKLQQVN